MRRGPAAEPNPGPPPAVPFEGHRQRNPRYEGHQIGDRVRGGLGLRPLRFIAGIGQDRFRLHRVTTPWPVPGPRPGRSHPHPAHCAEFATLSQHPLGGTGNPTGRPKSRRPRFDRALDIGSGRKGRTLRCSRWPTCSERTRRSDAVVRGWITERLCGRRKLHNVHNHAQVPAKSPPPGIRQQYLLLLTPRSASQRLWEGYGVERNRSPEADARRVLYPPSEVQKHIIRRVRHRLTEGDPVRFVKISIRWHRSQKSTRRSTVAPCRRRT